MDEELNFSLSYEQLFQVTEEQIKKCDLSKEGRYYIQELSKASDYLYLWNVLALEGFPGVGNYERVEADRQRLNALVYKN